MNEFEDSFAIRGGKLVECLPVWIPVDGLDGVIGPFVAELVELPDGLRKGGNAKMVRDIGGDGLFENEQSSKVTGEQEVGCVSAVCQGLFGSSVADYVELSRSSEDCLFVIILMTFDVFEGKGRFDVGKGAGDSCLDIEVRLGGVFGVERESFLCPMNSADKAFVVAVVV